MKKKQCNCLNNYIYNKDIIEIGSMQTLHCVGENVSIKNFNHYHFIYTKKNIVEPSMTKQEYLVWLFTYVPTGNYNNALYFMNDGSFQLQWNAITEAIWTKKNFLEL